MKLKHFFICATLAMLGCHSQPNQKQVDQPKVSNKPKKNAYRDLKSGLIKFSISDCKHECRGDSGKVWSNELAGDTLSLRLGHWLNCAWQHCGLSNVLLRNDTLSVDLYRVPEEVEIDEEGNEVMIYSMADCNCYYFLDLKLKRVPSKPKVFLVNRRPLENFWGEAPD